MAVSPVLLYVLRELVPTGLIIGAQQTSGVPYTPILSLLTRVSVTAMPVYCDQAC